MYETIQVKIRGWFLRALGFKALIRFNHVSCVSYQQGCYIYIHDRSIIFPDKKVGVTKKFFSQSCTNILGALTKNSAPQGKIESLGLSDTLKLTSKQTKLQTVAADGFYYYCCCYCCCYYYYYLN